MSENETNKKPKIAFVTAGGAGMFCGSCMQDNTLAKSLIELGVDLTLLPTYTPLKLDEKNVSNSKVFLGGVNVYLDWKYPIWRKIPRFMTRWLDSPRLLKLTGSLGISNDASELGGLAEAMLMGESGPEKVLIEEFANYLTNDLKPDVIIFSNALLVGTLKEIRKNFDGKIICLLQGDDLFLNGLEEPYKSHVLELLKERVKDFDQFVMHSSFYKKMMCKMLELDEEICHVIPLGIDPVGHTGQPGPAVSPFTVGYFARIAPEKGLLELVQAFKLFHERNPDSRLRVGGNLNKEHQPYFKKVQREAEALGDKFEYIGSPETHEEKVEFIKTLDVLSVPTVFEEPKGLYVLESLCNGVPVVQPNKGAFPELIESTGGGILFDVEDSQNSISNHAEAFEQLKNDEKLRMSLAVTGFENVQIKHSSQASAEAVLKLIGFS